MVDLDTSTIRNDGQTGIPVVFAASHNDEMQKEPFTLAISLGLAAIEVDVWLVDGVILAGHETKDLSPDKTLESIYLNPLLKLLDDQNSAAAGDAGWKGIFPGAPKQDLSLMIDMKGDGNALFDALLTALQPFIEKDYLSYYDKGQLHQRGITVIGTGCTPVERVFMANKRYVFLDAPLLELDKGFTIDDKHYEYDSSFAPMASGKWLWSSYYASVEALRKYSDAAHARGINARWWGVVRWPGPLRRYLWELQLKAGVDWLNADDLEDVAHFLRQKSGSARA